MHKTGCFLLKTTCLFGVFNVYESRNMYRLLCQELRRDKNLYGLSGCIFLIKVAFFQFYFSIIAADIMFLWEQGLSEQQQGAALHTGRGFCLSWWSYWVEAYFWGYVTNGVKEISALCNMVVISKDLRVGLAWLRCGYWHMLKPTSAVRHVNKISTKAAEQLWNMKSRAWAWNIC